MGLAMTIGTECYRVLDGVLPALSERKEMMDLEVRCSIKAT